MDSDRFDNLLRSLSGHASRRGALVGLTSGLLAVLPVTLRGDEAEAKKMRRKTKKPKLNAFGCVDVGKSCGGSDDRCCSGICEGEKPKKGKKDTSRCVAHHTGGCTPERSFCKTGSILSTCIPGDGSGVCLHTTGNAAFCATTADLSLENNCRVCSTDQDCESLGFPTGSACAIFTGVGCFGVNDCNGTNGSTGTACFPPGA